MPPHSPDADPPVTDHAAGSPAGVVLDAARFDSAVDALLAVDPALVAVVQRWGRPQFWSRPASFASLVLLVLEQQVSLASGKAAFDRIRVLVGEVVPERVARSSAAELHAAGTTRQKAGYVLDLATGVVDGTVDWATISTGHREDARRELLAVRGIGPWTADTWLLACRGFADEWPVGDRALQVGAGEVLDGPPLVGEDLLAAGRAWAPHRSSAARLVFHDYLCRRNRAETVVAGLELPVDVPATTAERA